MIHFEKANGFTLIEVLVALVILSIALLSLAGLMATTTRNNAAGGHLTEAATYAQDLLERLRLIPLGTLNGSFNPSTNYSNPDTANGDPPLIGSTGITYIRSWIYTPDVAPPDSNFDTITITVSWVDPAKLQSHSISMVSVISK